MASSWKRQNHLGDAAQTLPLPTPPSTSHSTSTTNSRPTFENQYANTRSRDVEKDDAALRTPTQTPPRSLSPFFSPEPDAQSKPSFEPPSSPSSESLPSHTSSRLDPLGFSLARDLPNKKRVSLSTRLEFLSRLALTEERVLPDQSLEILHRELDKLQHGMIEPADLDTTESYLGRKQQRRASDLEALRTVDASQKELLATSERLSNQLRNRQEEAKHVHELFTAKVEGLAQKCISLQNSLESATSQLKQANQSAQEKDNEIDDLVIENNALEVETQRLRDDVADKDLVMRAMGAAVGGLEGWLEDLPKRQTHQNDSAPLTPRRGGSNAIPRSTAKSSPRPGKRQREVIGGKGRFRGRYIIEEDDPSSPLNQHIDLRAPSYSGESDGPTDTSYHVDYPSSENLQDAEMMEGLRAWIGGFRDVEEGLKRKSPSDTRFSPMATQRRDTLQSETPDYG